MILYNTITTLLYPAMKSRFVGKCRQHFPINRGFIILYINYITKSQPNLMEGTQMHVEENHKAFNLY